jgi:hypothetical protein
MPHHRSGVPRKGDAVCIRGSVQTRKRPDPHVAMRIGPLRCESPALPLVLSWMIIYLTARPKPWSRVTGTASYPRIKRLLGLAPWRRLPVPLPRRRGTCVSLALYGYTCLRENTFPIVGSRRRTLRPAPTFFRVRALERPPKRARTSPKAVPGSSSPRPPGVNGC